MVPLTPIQIALACGAKVADAERFLPFIQGTCKAFDITSPRRISAFLSQIGHESAGLRRLEENLDYSVDALMRKFGRHRISAEDAQRYGRTRYQKSNPEGIANCIYGGSWGAANLGNTESGDGWRFRGRGLKQLTGRSNYRRCGQAIGENFTAEPERLLMPVNAALSAGWFWSTMGLNAIADREDIVTVTKLVNGGYNGLEHRIELYTKAMEVFA